MSKNKLKLCIFIVAFVIFLFSNIHLISASECEISVEKIEGLVYGNKLKDATIHATCDTVKGNFAFYDQEIILNQIGPIDVDVVFVSEDNSYIERLIVPAVVEKRKISVVFDSLVYKQYDGNTSINLPSHTYAGIINDEVAVEGELGGVISASYVGEGIPLILNGISIVGDKKDNYYLDLLEHSAIIYPAILEKQGKNATKIALEKDIYLDVGYSLLVKDEVVDYSIKDKYTSFVSYTYQCFNHNGVELYMGNKINVSMKLDEDIMEKERLEIFELTKEGEHKILEYSYKNGVINYKIDGGSSVVFATRDIEYNIIFLFLWILLGFVIISIVFRLTDKRMKNYKNY